MNKKHKGVCLRVSHNGRKLCVAGVGPDGVISAVVSWVGSKPEAGQDTRRNSRAHLHVGGLYEKPKGVSAYAAWVRHLALRVGDSVTIEMVNGTPDRPENEVLKTERSIREEWRKHDEATRRRLGLPKAPSSLGQRRKRNGRA